MINFGSFSHFYENFLLENVRKEREEKYDLVKFLEKFQNEKDVMFSFRDYIDNEKIGAVNPLIGINPKTKFSTPNGIYGYPLEETKHEVKTDSLPFGSNRPIVVVYKPKKNVRVVRTSTFSKDDLNESLEKLAKITNLTIEDLRELIDYEIDLKYAKNNAQTLWSLVRILSQRNVNKWSKMMIDIGIPIFIDDNGSGTIHQNESTQCVVFGKNFVEVLGVLEKKKPINAKFSSIKLNFNSLCNNLIQFSFDEKQTKKVFHKMKNFLKHSGNFTIHEIYDVINALNITAKTIQQDFDKLEELTDVLLEHHNFSRNEQEDITKMLLNDNFITDYSYRYTRFTDYTLGKIFDKFYIDAFSIWKILRDRHFRDGKILGNFLKEHFSSTDTTYTWVLNRFSNILKDSEKMNDFRKNADSELKETIRIASIDGYYTTHAHKYITFYIYALPPELQSYKSILDFFVRIKIEPNVYNSFMEELLRPKNKKFVHDLTNLYPENHPTRFYLIKMLNY